MFGFRTEAEVLRFMAQVGFAQKAVFAGSLNERLISDPLLPFRVAPVREESATTGPSRCGHSEKNQKAALFPGRKAKPKTREARVYSDPHSLNGGAGLWVRSAVRPAAVPIGAPT